MSAGRTVGDDFTGLLSIPAGIASLGVGTFTLWQSRRRNGGLAGSWRGALPSGNDVSVAEAVVEVR